MVCDWFRSGWRERSKSWSGITSFPFVSFRLVYFSSPSSSSPISPLYKGPPPSPSPTTSIIPSPSSTGVSASKSNVA